MKPLFVTLLAACLVTLFASLASAQTERFSLEYSAPAGCPSEDEFRDEVAARLGRIPFGETGTKLLVTILPQKDGFLGTLELTDGERVLRNNDCAALARDLSAALAVRLDAPTGGQGVRGGIIGGVIQMAPSENIVEVEKKEKVHVAVQADDENLTLHAIRSHQFAYGAVAGQAATAFTYEFQALCTAPCELDLEPQEYHFAVGQGVNTPVPLDVRTRVEGPSRIAIDYRSRKGWRLAGFLLATVGSLGGLGLFVKGLADEDKSMAITGGAISLGALFTGMAMMVVGDKPKLELTRTP